MTYFVFGVEVFLMFEVKISGVSTSPAAVIIHQLYQAFINVKVDFLLFDDSILGAGNDSNSQNTLDSSSG